MSITLLAPFAAQGRRKGSKLHMIYRIWKFLNCQHVYKSYIFMYGLFIWKFKNFWVWELVRVVETPPEFWMVGLMPQELANVP